LNDVDDDIAATHEHPQLTVGFWALQFPSHEAVAAHVAVPAGGCPPHSPPRKHVAMPLQSLLAARMHATYVGPAFWQLREHMESGAAPHALIAAHAPSQTCLGVEPMLVEASPPLPLPLPLLPLPHATNESEPQVAIHQTFAVRIIVQPFSRTTERAGARLRARHDRDGIRNLLLRLRRRSLGRLQARPPQVRCPAHWRPRANHSLPASRRVPRLD
jgi:hypothetical protein